MQKHEGWGGNGVSREGFGGLRLYAGVTGDGGSGCITGDGGTKI